MSLSKNKEAIPQESLKDKLNSHEFHVGTTNPENFGVTLVLFP